MPKKTSIIILLIIFPLVVGLACRFTSRADPTATPTEEPVVVVATEAIVEPTTPPPTPEVIVVEEEEAPTPEPVEEIQDLRILEKSNWFQDGDIVFVGYLIENTTSATLYEDMDISIKLFGAAGNLIDQGYSYVPFFYPESTAAAVSTFYLSDESIVVDSVVVDWTFTGTSSASPTDNPFTAENLIFWENSGSPVVTGRIVNNSDLTYTGLTGDIICYNSAGEVVGGGLTYLDFIHLNDYMGFITYVDVFDDVASIDVFPSLSYSSEVIDKTDFTSEIAILDANYYEDTFGGIQFGAVVQNITDNVLRSSYIYITFYDADRNITTAGGYNINMLLPGDTLGISPYIFSPPDDARTVDLDILLLPGYVLDDFELESNPFRVNSTEITGDFENYVLVNFTNTYSKQVTDVDVFVLVYDADGAIIGGGRSWTTDPIPAGGSTEIEIWVYYGYDKTVESVEAWVMPSSFTKFD